MSELFEKTVEAGFSRVLATKSEGQLACRKMIQQNLGQLLFVRLRERFLKEVVICIGAFVGSDEDECLTLTSFSQQQMFTAYDSLVYQCDKIDFLFRALAHGICVVAIGFEERLMVTVLEAVTNQSAPPERVLAKPQILDKVPLKRRTASGESLLRKIAVHEELLLQAQELELEVPILTAQETGRLEADVMAQMMMDRMLAEKLAAAAGSFVAAPGCSQAVVQQSAEQKKNRKYFVDL